MKKMAKYMAFAVLAAVLVSFTACGGTDKTAEGSGGGGQEYGLQGGGGQTEPHGKISVNICVMNEFRNLDRILDRYYEMTAFDPVLSQIKLNFSYVDSAEYKEMLKSAIRDQEDYDLIFVGSWQGRDAMITDGSFKNVTKYFYDEENYPGLAGAFSEELLSSQKVEGELYTVPVLTCMDDLKGLCYREDLRKKYGCEEIRDEVTLRAYLDTITDHLDNEDMVCAWGVSGQGFMTFRSNNYERARNGIHKVTAGTDFWVYVKDGKVVNAVTGGDDESAFADFPEGFRRDFITEDYQELVDWTQYINEDAAAGGDSVDFNTGLCAATYKSFSEYAALLPEVKKSIPEAVVGFYVFDGPQRNMEPGAITSSFAANNTVVVPAWSPDEKTDAVMHFLDALYGNKEINDLFTYGVEGVDWESADGKVITRLEVAEQDKYIFPTYCLVDAPNFYYYPSEITGDKKLLDYYEYMLDLEGSYTLEEPISGFVFDKTNVEKEVAAISNVSGNYNMFIYGSYKGETGRRAKAMNEEMKNAGLEKVRAEIISQLQEYIDAR